MAPAELDRVLVEQVEGREAVLDRGAVHQDGVDPAPGGRPAALDDGSLQRVDALLDHALTAVETHYAVAPDERIVTGSLVHDIRMEERWEGVPVACVDGGEHFLDQASFYLSHAAHDRNRRGWP